MLKSILEGNNRGKKARVIKFLETEIFGNTNKIDDIITWKSATPCKDSRGITVEYRVRFDDGGVITAKVFESYQGKMMVKYQDVWTNEFVSKQELYRRHKEEYIPKGYSYKSELEEISLWK